MELGKLVLVVVVLVTFYASYSEAVQCYSCTSYATTKSKSRDKDPCYPKNLEKSGSKSGTKSGSRSRVTISTNCDYCLTLTTHYDQGNEYFSYYRSCGYNIGSTKGCSALATYANKDNVIRLEYSGYSTTSTCCDNDNKGKPCNKNGVTGLHATVMVVLGLLGLYKML